MEGRPGYAVLRSLAAVAGVAESEQEFEAPRLPRRRTLLWRISRLCGLALVVGVVLLAAAARRHRRAALPLRHAPGEEVALIGERQPWCANALRPRDLWDPDPGSPKIFVKLLTYNLFWHDLFTLRHGNHRSAGKLIKSSGIPVPYDLMGFQECQDAQRVLRDAELLGEYTAFQSRGNNTICMAFRKASWSLEEMGDERVAEDMRGLFGERAVQWMRLRHNSGTRVFFMNHHGPLPINTGGICGGRATAYNILRVIGDHAKPGDGIVLLGDFNADGTSEELHVLQEYLLHVYAGSYLNGIDNVFSNVHRLQVVSTKTLAGGGSDHDALNAIIEVGELPSQPAPARLPSTAPPTTTVVTTTATTTTTTATTTTATTTTATTTTVTTTTTATTTTATTTTATSTTATTTTVTSTSTSSSTTTTAAVARIRSPKKMAAVNVEEQPRTAARAAGAASPATTTNAAPTTTPGADGSQGSWHWWWPFNGGGAQEEPTTTLPVATTTTATTTTITTMTATTTTVATTTTRTTTTATTTTATTATTTTTYTTTTATTTTATTTTVTSTSTASSTTTTARTTATTTTATTTAAPTTTPAPEPTTTTTSTLPDESQGSWPWWWPFHGAPATTITTTTTLPTTTTQANCDSKCVPGQKMSTSCRASVLWYAKYGFHGKPNACANAHGLVMDRCSGCWGCKLEAVCSREAAGGGCAEGDTRCQSGSPGAPEAKFSGELAARAAAEPPLRRWAPRSWAALGAAFAAVGLSSFGALLLLLAALARTRAVRAAPHELALLSART